MKNTILALALTLASVSVAQAGPCLTGGMPRPCGYSSSYRVSCTSNVYRSKRGVEQLLFRSTIVLAVVFVGVALTNVLIR